MDRCEINGLLAWAYGPVMASQRIWTVSVITVSGISIADLTSIRNESKPSNSLRIGGS